MSLRRWPLLVAFLLLATSCGAQAPAATATADAALHRAEPTLRIVSRLIYVNVVVRDGNGRLVHVLQQGDFTVLENKQPRRIALFAEHTPPATLDARAPAGLSNVPQNQEAALNILLFDLLDTDLLDQEHARQRMLAFLQQLPPGHRVALFVLGNSLKMVQGLTGSSDLLAAAAQTIHAQQIDRLRSTDRRLSDDDNIAAVDAPNQGRSVLGQAIRNAIDAEDATNFRARLDSTRIAFEGIARAVSGYSGRKNLFWLAGDFPDPDQFSLQSLSARQPAATGQGSTGTGRLYGAASILPSNVLNREGAVEQVLADSGIAVYPISLVGVETDSVGAGIAGNGYSQGAGLKAAFTSRQNSRSAMESIAESTGGHAFYGNNDPAQMLTRGFEEAENFYTLAYQPTDSNWNGQYRQIRLRLRSSGYQLTYRRGYFALPQQPVRDPVQQFAAAMLPGSLPSTQLLLHGAPPRVISPVPSPSSSPTPSSTPAATSSEVEFDTTLDVQDVTFSHDRAAHLQVVLYAFPQNGKGEQAGVNHELNIDVSPENFLKLQQAGMPLNHRIHLKPGIYTLQLGVLDAGSGRFGTLTTEPFTVPASLPADR